MQILFFYQQTRIEVAAGDVCFFWQVSDKQDKVSRPVYGLYQKSVDKESKYGRAVQDVL